MTPRQALLSGSNGSAAICIIVCQCFKLAKQLLLLRRASCSCSRWLRSSEVIQACGRPDVGISDLLSPFASVIPFASDPSPLQFPLDSVLFHLLFPFLVSSERLQTFLFITRNHPKAFITSNHPKAGKALPRTKPQEDSVPSCHGGWHC